VGVQEEDLDWWSYTMVNLFDRLFRRIF